MSPSLFFKICTNIHYSVS
uniref:Uncharacterized protein n=1 Tax=Arundo donax TaxID=35708 RepID=A0A0A9AST0_ARUDO